MDTVTKRLGVALAGLVLFAAGAFVQDQIARYDEKEAQSQPQEAYAKAWQTRQKLLRSGKELHVGKEAEVLPHRRLLDGWSVSFGRGTIHGVAGDYPGTVATVKGSVRNDAQGAVGSDKFEMVFRFSGDQQSAGWVICDVPVQKQGQTSAITCVSIVNVEAGFDKVELGDPNE